MNVVDSITCKVFVWGCIGDVHRKHRQAPRLFYFIVKIMYTLHVTYDQRNAFCKPILLYRMNNSGI